MSRLPCFNCVKNNLHGRSNCLNCHEVYYDSEIFTPTDLEETACNQELVASGFEGTFNEYQANEEYIVLGSRKFEMHVEEEKLLQNQSLRPNINEIDLTGIKIASGDSSCGLFNDKDYNFSNYLTSAPSSESQQGIKLFQQGPSSKHSNEFYSQENSGKRGTIDIKQRENEETACELDYISVNDVTTKDNKLRQTGNTCATAINSQCLELNKSNRNSDTFQNEESLQISKLNVSQKRIDSSKEDCRSSTCAICGRQFDDHVNSDSKEKPYQCCKCGYICKKKCRLSVHSRTHTGEKPFSCKECGKQFSGKESLNSHIRNHTGDKLFSCIYCEKKFVKKTFLFRHFLTHTGERPFSCKYCKKTFNTNGNMNRHMLTHTGEKPFSCIYCEKKFASKTILDRHVLTHTDEKPFQCEICDRRFIRKDRLKEHAKKVHPAKLS